MALLLVGDSHTAQGRCCRKPREVAQALYRIWSLGTSASVRDREEALAFYLSLVFERY